MVELKIRIFLKKLEAVLEIIHFLFAFFIDGLRFSD